MLQWQPMSKPTPSPRQRAKAALKALLKEAGGKAPLGEAIGITRQAVGQWKGVVPEKQLRRVCEVFNRKPEDVRPDLSKFQIANAMRKPETNPSRARA